MEFRDINFVKLSEYARALAQKVEDSGYVPDHMLYVERVGLFLGCDMASYFNCSISGIHASRSGASVKSKLKVLLRFLPRWVTHYLRGLEIKSNIHGIQKEREVHVEGAWPPKDKKLLIVDDAVDTGSSLKAIADFLISHGYDPCNLKTAVLTVTHHNPVVRPDFTLFENVGFAFPWSYDSRGYKTAWERYDKLKATVGNNAP